MKKQLIIFTIFCILLAGIVIATPALENIYGVKNFVDGLQSNGATVATLDANSKVPLANIYYLPIENRIMNSNFEVAQRGTSFSDPNTGTYTLDRFKVLFSVDGGTNPTIIHSQQTFTPGTLYNSKNFYRVNVNGAGSSYGANSYYAVAQYIENGTSKLCGNGKQVTVSFQASSDIANKKIGVYLIQNYGTGGSPTSAETIDGTNFTLTSSMTEYSHSFTTNTLSGKTFGTANDDALIVMIVYEWGSTYDANIGDTSAESFVGSGNINIAQLELYEGNINYPYTPASFEEELRRCQRYFESSYTYLPQYKKYPGDIDLYNMFVGKAQTGNTFYQEMIKCLVPKRVSNTILFYSPATGAVNNIRDANAGVDLATTSSSATVIGQNSFRFFHDASGLTVGKQYYLHWTWDADF